MTGKGSFENRHPVDMRLFARLQERLSKPDRVSGERIKELAQALDLHSTEVGYMLGLNNSAVYRKQGHNDTLTAGVSILMRCYTSMPETVKRRTPPSPTDLMKLIASVDPTIMPHHLNVILGLEQSAAHRFRDSLDENASQVVRVLSLLIWETVTENPDNWYIIKQNIENEAEARGIQPGCRVWETLGGWQDRQGAARKRKKKADKKTE